jgi:hypothetical protein
MMRAWARLPAVAAFVLVALLAISEAQAGSRIVLLEFSGRKADVLREKVQESLERAGHTVVLSKSPSQGTSAEQIRRLAKRSEADAVVAGRVRRHSMRHWSVALSVSDPEGGDAEDSELQFRSSWLPGLAKQLSDNASKRLAAVLARADEPMAAAVEAEVWDADKDTVSDDVVTPSASDITSDEAPATPEDDSLFESDPSVISDRDSDVTSKSDEASGVVVRLGARGGLVYRSLDFSDDIYNRLRTQRANIWVYRARGELYPFERPIGERLGLIASYESVFSGNVRDADFGANFPVIFQEAFGGVRARHPLGLHEIGFELTFGRMQSGLEDERNEANIPDMSYTLLRSSLDFRLHLGRLRAVGSAGFRLPLAYGQVSHAEWFPRIGGYGFEASGGMEYPLSKAVSLELIGDLRRYLLEMNSEPEDALGGIAEVAGGAVDLYLGGYFGMTFRL